MIPGPAMEALGALPESDRAQVMQAMAADPLKFMTMLGDFGRIAELREAGDREGVRTIAAKYETTCREAGLGDLYDQLMATV